MKGTGIGGAGTIGASAGTGITALTNVNVIDVMRDRIRKNASVLVRAGRITDILDGGPPAAGVDVIDCRGGYLIPGLIDAHSHITFPCVSKIHTRLFGVMVKQTERNFAQYINSGITTVRDMGAFTRLLGSYLKKMRTGVMVGPRVLYCSVVLNNKGGHPDWSLTDMHPLGRILEWNMGEGAAYFTTLGDLDRRLAQNMDRNPHHIKLTFDNVSAITGKRWIPVYTDEQLRVIFSAAERHNLPVAGHVHTRFGFLRALKAGVDSIEHVVIDEPPTRAEVKLMRQKNIAIVPTLDLGLMLAMPEAYNDVPDVFRTDFIMNELSIRQRFLDNHDPRYGDPRIHRANLEGIEAFKTYGEKGLTRRRWFYSKPELNFRILKQGPAILKMMRSEGILIGCGTDAGLAFIYHGMLWREMELMHRAGFSAAEVLRCATINNAKILRMEREIGSIERGKCADLVLLRSNPYRDITAYREPLMVMREGAVVCDREGLAGRVLVQ